MGKISASLLKRLEKDVILVAEGYIFELERRGYIMADFAIKVRDIGINYIGICCGAGRHHVRAMAEGLGREVPASKYSPDVTLHPVFGDQESRNQNYIECIYGPNIK